MRQLKEPREGYEEVAGIPWLARMIDKARLQAEGHLEALDLDFPCPIDQGLLRQLGLDHKTFQEIVMRCQTDDQIVAELKKRHVIR